MSKRVHETKIEHSMRLRIIGDRLFRLGLCLAILCLSATANPVNLSAQEEQEQEQLALVDLEGVDDTARLILSTIRESNPKTASELAYAIKVVLDVGQYQDARVYLTQLEALSLNQNQLFDFQQEVGSDFVFLIHTEPALQPEGKTFAKKVLAASQAVANSPARLASLLQQLNDQDISVRSDAFRKLRRLGEPGVAFLLNTFADVNKKSLYPGVRGALKSMGPDAQAPLLGGARATDAQVHVESIRALSNLETSEAYDEMMRAYLSPKASQVGRRIALDYLSSKKRMAADPDYIERRLYERSMQYLMGKREAPGAFLNKVTLWSWDPVSKQMVPREVTGQTASRVIASHRASDLFEIRPDLARNREMYLLTQLEAQKRLVGRSKRIAGVATANRLQTDANEVNGLLERSLEMELVPAAIACCEILGEIGSNALLSGGSSKPRPLVQAILFGDRHLQFAAFEAIAKIDPRQAYAGSSYMVTLATYLAQSENRPMGLVGHNRGSVSQTYAASMVSAGIFGQSASNSREFFDIATNNPDIEVMIVTDTLDRPDYADLIQQLKKDWRTKRIPIALLYRDTNRSRRVSMRIGDDPRFIPIPFAMEPERVASHVEQLRATEGPFELTNFDRRKHAAAAVKWLANVAENSEFYPFYNLGPHESKLVRLLYIPGFAEQASSILSNLGTPLAQREMVNFASQSTAPLDERKKVVEAFSASVAKGGALLTSREIQLQYDRYNASEGEPESTQNVLGSILDVIETRKGD